MFKKACSILLVFVLSCGGFGSIGFAAENDTNSNSVDVSPIDVSPIVNEAVFDLSSLGVIEGDENGNMNLSSHMTRAEFAKVAVNLTGADEGIASYSGNSKLYDVPNDYWGRGYIGYAIDRGIMSGDGDGYFRPEANITLAECIKTLVNIMGYEVVAKEKGGYPEGYYNVARSKHIMDSVTGRETDSAVRRDIVVLVYNALDVPNLVSNYSSEAEYREDPNETIRTIIEKAKNLYSQTGIVTAYLTTWLKAPIEALEKNQIEIDGTIYDSNIESLGKYIGQEVRIYYKRTDNMKHPIISNIQETRKNTVTVVSAQDMTNFTADKFEYWDKTRTKDIFLSKDAKYVYNNRVETSFKDDFSKIEDGTISLKDNNGDKKIDYVFIDNSVDYVVENLANNGNIKVKYLVESGNTSEIKYSNITLKIDEENACSIESVDGTEVQYKDIKKGDVISVFTNNTDDFIRVVVGKNEKFEGSVTAKKQDGNITIKDEAYYVSNLAVFNTLLVGQSYEFYQKFNGNIIYAEKKVQAESAWKYGYILGMTKEKDGTYRVLVVDSGKIENREEVDESDKTNANKIPVTLCGNKAVTEYVVADKLTIDGSTGKSVNIENQIHKPLRYATDAKGDLKKIETITFVGGGSGMKYNAKEKVFGGIRILDPFMIDEKTNVICLPSSGSTSTDDLLTRIYIDNKDTLLRYNTQGYEIVDETGAVELFVITAEMDATSTKGVYQNSSKMGLVSEAAMCLNDENEEYMSITMITGKEVKSIETLPLTDRRKDLRELKNGDFIFYSEDADGKIDNVIIAKNVLDIENSYHTGQYSLNEQMAGYVTDIRLNKIDNLSLQKVNEVDVLIEVNETVKLPITNNPDIFIYNKNTDTVEAGTIDDIVPYSEITENSERVLVVMPNATVRALVIIR